GGQGDPGTALIKAVSGLLPTLNVVMFGDENYIPLRPGLLPGAVRCIEPDARDTNYPDEATRERDVSLYRAWGTSFFYQMLNQLPFAAEDSPHAKMARNGRVVRWPVTEASSRHAAPRP